MTILVCDRVMDATPETSGSGPSGHDMQIPELQQRGVATSSTASTEWRTVVSPYRPSKPVVVPVGRSAWYPEVLIKLRVERRLHPLPDEQEASGQPTIRASMAASDPRLTGPR